jgi:hypothetical protein
LVTLIEEVWNTFADLYMQGSQTATLLIAHPEIRPNFSHNSLPIVLSTPFSQSTHDQLNNRWEFSTAADHLCSTEPAHSLVSSGEALNVVNQVMKLT